jgi:Outer membrane protein beta-barrel domain
MKKSFLFAGLTILTINISMAQSNKSEGLKFGLKVGTNYSNIYDSQGDKFDAKGKFGFAGGVFLAVPLGAVLGIQPEILFSQKGYEQTGAFLGSNYKLKRTTDYIDIPLLLAIKPVEVLSILIGPQYSFLTRQKDVFSNSSTTIEQQKDFKNQNIRKNTLCLVGGLDFNLSNVILGARAGFDVQNNNGDGTSTNPRYKNTWVQATIGFKIL